MPRITAIKGEVGTTGNVERVEITGDAAEDITRAIESEHYGCDSACCDISRAYEDGYPYWSANLLMGATETPLLDAVVSYYCRAGLDFGALAESDRVEWLRSDTWTQHAHECDGCGAYNFGSDLWTPTECENCGAALPRLTDDELDQFVTGYLECALWSTSVEEDYASAHDVSEDTSMLDAGLTVNDVDDDARETIAEDCRDFAEANYRDLREYVARLGEWHGSDDARGAGARYSGWERAGGDFLLTRNGHGAGFWDRGLGELGERLTAASKAHGETYLYVGDDGVIYTN